MTPTGFHRLFWSALRDWWQQQSQQNGIPAASAALARELWAYLRDSTPERRRSRYGDMEYDWEHRVNTTSGSVGWKDRLLGVFLSPYQPTDAALFQEMMSSLALDFSQFTFVDLGSGKGRTLLMASEYPFRRIVGVEVLPELHRAAEGNIASYRSTTQQCRQVETVCADAREFDLPDDPLLLYLFNPLPAVGLSVVLEKLERSLQSNPRPVCVLYHNPVLEECLLGCPCLERVTSVNQFAIYRSSATPT